MNGFEHLTSLPGTEAEKKWLTERLETLSEKETSIAGAISIGMQPETMAQAIDQLLSMEDYNVCFPAGSYAALGRFYLRHEASLPEDAIPYANLDRLGMLYEDRHPGLFMGNCYVAYPDRPHTVRYNGQGGQIPEDDGWSVKVKLASPARPEGVWLRLPDNSCLNDGRPDEVALALDALEVENLNDCILLGARCCLSEAGDLMEQYQDVEELVRDGNDLGYLLDEQGQGMPHFAERYAAALEYEDCRDLRFALDIAQNLSCYEWVDGGSLKDFGRQSLLAEGVPVEVLDSGCIDLEGYAEQVLEDAGYSLTGDERAYIARNSREFLHERTTPGGPGMTMQ